MFLNRLYVRIWLAVVVTVAVLTLLVGWIVRLTAEPPFRQVVVRDETGQVIGSGRPRARWGEGAEGWNPGRRGGGPPPGMARRPPPPPDDAEEGAEPVPPGRPGATGAMRP